jgi:predicted kinase
MKAVICVGISASGKSTFAKDMEKEGYVDVNRDWIRFNVVCPGADWKSYKFTKERESRVTEIQENYILECARAGANIIISDTNINPKTRSRLEGLCLSLGYDVEIKDFPITLEEAWRRDALRPNGVGYSVIYKQYQQWLEYVGRRKYVPNKELPKAIIVDIDGTIASHEGIRGPYEWDKVFQDKPRKVILDIVNGLLDDYIIIVLSGRDSVCLPQTLHWLDDYLPNWDELYMRPEGDMRKDSIVKEEMFWEEITPFYNIVGVIDDRPQVVRLWHEIGIENVICVGNPWEEF